MPNPKENGENPKIIPCQTNPLVQKPESPKTVIAIEMIKKIKILNV